MKTLTVTLEPAMAQAVEKLAGLRGISEEKYALAAVKLLVDTDIDSHVRDLLGVDPSELDPAEAETPTDSEADGREREVTSD